MDNLLSLKKKMKTAKKLLDNTRMQHFHEVELKTKTARLDELNILLNMDKQTIKRTMMTIRRNDKKTASKKVPVGTCRSRKSHKSVI